MPKRQAEQLVERAAQDFESFYAQRQQSEPANDTAATEHTAEDIVHKLRGANQAPVRELSRPERKRVAATVRNSLVDGISEMFDEADRRDPKRERPCVVLVDGDPDQIDQVERQATARGRPISLVLDLLHVLHYIWLAGMAIRRGDAKQVGAWVNRYRYRLLTVADPLNLIAGINQSATLARLTDAERESVDKCVGYLKSNICYIHYAEYLARGFPIATGIIEGACRHLIQDRLGITGARWEQNSAEAVLRLRALWTNGDWDEYWRFHRRREFERRTLRAAG